MASLGPQLPPSAAAKRKREDDQHLDDSPSPTRPRTIGPTLPPADLDERPTTAPETDSEDGSDGDDDFGPSLPSANAPPTHSKRADSRPSSNDLGSQAPAKTARDEWMIVPPSDGDWSSRVDPTKLRARKFNTGKGAKGPSQGSGGGIDNKWLETPAEKRARLEREMMGIKDTTKQPKEAPRDHAKLAAASQKIREYTEKSRGPTLYEEHQKSNPREKEDDPSARAFDREKDIAGGMKINTTQRNEMMKKAADFGSRFSSAKYL